MKCPQCNSNFRLTWQRYTRASFGRMSCPLCQAKLFSKHRWFYWPLVVLGCCALGTPLAYLGGRRYALVGGLAGWVAGAIVIGVPFDWFLESKFSVLRIRDVKSSNNPDAGDG